MISVTYYRLCITERKSTPLKLDSRDLINGKGDKILYPYPIVYGRPKSKIIQTPKRKIIVVSNKRYPSYGSKIIRKIPRRNRYRTFRRLNNYY